MAKRTNKQYQEHTKITHCNYARAMAEIAQNHSISKWCRKKGIPLDVINGHKQLTDVVFLIGFYDEFAFELRSIKSAGATFDAYWGTVYHRQKPLLPKAFKKFELIHQQCMQHRDHLQAIRIKAKSLRTNRDHPKINVDHDTTANGSYLPGSKTLEKGTTGAPSSVADNENEKAPWE